MLSLEQVRQAVTSEFKRVHDLGYPNTPVNYENFSVIEIDPRLDPFVTFSMKMTDTAQTALGEDDIFGSGELSPIFYYAEGRGTQGAYEYADHLNGSMAMQTLNGIYYRAAKPPIRVVTFPGWVGLMCRIPFEQADGLVCTQG